MNPMHDSALHETVDDLASVVEEMLEDALEGLENRLAFEAYADNRE